MIFYGPPGIGKTSFAAQIPGVVFLVDSQEVGIHKLKEFGLVNQSLPIFPAVSSWEETLAVIDQLRTGEHSYRCLALDAIGGFERLCHQHVCSRDFNGDWGERGFASYQRGYEVSMADWRLFIQALDALRIERRMSVVLLGHARVTPFKNPTGPDYDRYAVDIHHKTWSLTHKWADMVLFANYETEFSAKDAGANKARPKGIKSRVIYTEQESGFDAKNRHNLPPTIDMGDDAAGAWKNFAYTLQQAKKVNHE